MTSARSRNAAQNTHLVRAARSAGEVFAYTSPDPDQRQPGRTTLLVLWIGAGALAALGLFLAI
jgi:hypothetical protein